MSRLVLRSTLCPSEGGGGASLAGKVEQSGVEPGRSISAKMQSLSSIGRPISGFTVSRRACSRRHATVAR